MIKKIKLTAQFTEFFKSEKSGGLLLLLLTVLSLIISNSSLSSEYISFWNISFANHSLLYWINDGLMAIFFLLIGLELKREILIGELSNFKIASLPIVSAIGGMVVPILIYFILNAGTPAQSGLGIPMATDIAFAIGILSLLGNRIPPTLKIFLTALAVIDDLGAILIIAIFYTTSISLINLTISISIFCLLYILNIKKINYLAIYLIGGIIMWYFMLKSGVHPTITGVLLAVAIPFRNNKEKSPLIKLEHFLNKPVALIILPLFAMANTCIVLDNEWFNGIETASSIGIILGLVIGKPLGITIFSYFGTLIKLCKLPKDLKWSHIIGVGFLGGIGFTMSIFITLLAFDNYNVIQNSKIAILIASFIAGTIGIIWLRILVKKN